MGGRGRVNIISISRPVGGSHQSFFFNGPPFRANVITPSTRVFLIINLLLDISMSNKSINSIRRFCISLVYRVSKSAIDKEYAEATND